MIKGIILACLLSINVGTKINEIPSNVYLNNAQIFEETIQTVTTPEAQRKAAKFAKKEYKRFFKAKKQELKLIKKGSL